MNSLLRNFAVTGLALAVVLDTYGQAANQISSVTPASVSQGATATFTFTLETDVPPPPPPGILPTSVKLGTNLGTSITHPATNTVTAQFTFPGDEPVGTKDAVVTFATPNGTLTFSKAGAVTVTAGSGVTAKFTASPTGGSLPLTVWFTNNSTGSITNQLWNFGDGTTSAAVNPFHTFTNRGSFSVSLTVFGPAGTNQLIRSGYITVTAAPVAGGFAVVDTGQTRCYNNTTTITAPLAGQPFYGQDAQCLGVQPSYTLSADGLTVLDHRTGLTWQRTPDTSGDGQITAADKLNWAGAQARPAALNAVGYGGYNDWRLPSIKELYSLINFNGTDPSGLSGSAAGLTPFIDTNYFKFAYGDTNAGERLIDSQYASSTLYVSTAFEQALFGVNFADGRIKGYGLSVMGSDKTFFVQCVRGNPAYGLNLLVDNGDQTVTDRATGLMWSKNDSGVGMNWSNALALAQTSNAARFLGYSDWRLPDAKELQSIVDYTRSPDTTGSAAIDPVFLCTPILNERYQADYPWYWSGTTHAQYNGSGAGGAYVCFGRSLGYMNSAWVDIHGAGCQRSDPKASLAGYTQLDNGYYNSIAPQGDAVRLYNFVRLVRTARASDDSVGDGIPNAWRAYYFGGTGTATNSISCATADPDNDGRDNQAEYVADTNPTNAASVFRILNIMKTDGVSVWYPSSSNRTYTLWYATNLLSGVWTNVPSQTSVSGTGGMDVLTDSIPAGSLRFYRVSVQLP